VGSADNCPTVSNPGQDDTDADGIGDACDPTSGVPTTDKPGVTVDDGSRTTLALDQVVSADQGTDGKLVSPAVTTAGGNELVIASVSADGPANGLQRVTSMSGGGLVWTPVVRSDIGSGDAETWEAYTPDALAGIQVAAKLGAPAPGATITVATFSGASPHTSATAAEGTETGDPINRLVRARDGGLSWSVGHLWDSATTPIAAPGDSIRTSSVNSATKDVSWTETSGQDIPAGNASVVTATATPNSRWNLATVEIDPADAPAGPTSPSSIRTANLTGSPAKLSSPPIPVDAPGQLLVAYVSADGPPTHNAQRVSALTGGGLTWSLVRRADAEFGTAEVWQAVATVAGRIPAITASLAAPGYDGSIVVSTYSAAARIVDSAASSGTAPTASIAAIAGTPGDATVTVGHLWSHARTVGIGADQTLTNLMLDTTDDTTWMQQGSIATPGAALQIDVGGRDHWNLVSIALHAT
jgi:hypothetical protein